MKIKLKFKRQPLKAKQLKNVFHALIKMMPDREIMRMYGYDNKTGLKYILMENIGGCENMWLYEKQWTFAKIVVVTEKK